MPVVIGLDAAAKVIGVAVVQVVDFVLEVKLDTWVEDSKSVGCNLDRASNHAEKLLELVRVTKPDLVVLEGYALGFKGFNLVKLVEVGTVLRYFLKQVGVRYMEVPPTSLKKFVCGSGSATKSMILKEVYKRFNVDAKDEDQADAAGLAFMGMGLIAPSVVNLTKDQKNILGKFPLIEI